MPLIAAYSTSGHDQNSILRRVSYDISKQRADNMTRCFPAVVIQPSASFFPELSDVSYTCLMTNDVCFELKREITERVQQNENMKIQELRETLQTVRKTLKKLESEHSALKQRMMEAEEKNTQLNEAHDAMLRKLNLYQENEWEELSALVEESCAK